jgi:serine/threonine protein kinase
MSVTIGSVLGSYEITALLGKGGFGEVYRAKDKKLKRDVAIKILPAEFSTDHDRLTRFQREAEVLASLNHPNIAAIYDLAAQDQSQFLVLELVDGETLADRIARGPIPVEETLNIAKQICEALEAAHEKGIIHRDLKPANIKLTPDGKVKVLDFGLAKAYEAKGARVADLSNSPTMLTNASLQGVIMGTAAYMSPEQTKGKEVDNRTDIFAFGCVLYEMLTGQRCFDGEDVSDILGSVLKTEPDWTLLPPDVAPRTRDLLRLCLEKNVKNRRSDATDVRLDIELALKESPVFGAIATQVRNRPGRLGWIVGGLAVVASVLFATAYFNVRNTPESDEVRLELTTPTTQAPLSFALSPDGKSLVFVASGGGPQRLWLRRLDKTDVQPLADTDGANYPFWSPNNGSIGFFANGKLKRFDLPNGPPRVLADAPTGRGGTWSTDNTILFAPLLGAPLYRLSASGGQASVITKLGPGHTNHRWPQFLPDGKSFLYYALGGAETRGIYIGNIGSAESKRLTAADTAAAYLPPDRIVFMRHTALFVQRFDISRQTLVGDPITIADPVASDDNSFGLGFAVSSSGRLAYRAATANQRQLVWFDRAGKQLGVAGEPDSANVRSPELSLDGRRLVVERTVQGNRDIWWMDLVHGSLNRLTDDPALDGDPIWSPDGTKVAFNSTRKGPSDIYLKAVNETGQEHLLGGTVSTNSIWPLDWSRNGRFLLYHTNYLQTGDDLIALPIMGDDRKPIVIANTQFSEDNGQFSPNGRWVAYQTDESGRNEIVVQSFPDSTLKFHVSTGGGIYPRWRSDGKELYFISPDAKLMAATVRPSPSGFDFDTPTALFQTNLYFDASKAQYAVSADGRFLINQSFANASPPPITLILNWHPKDSK